MVKLDNFVDMMTGHFNNKEQFDNMQKDGKIYESMEVNGKKTFGYDEPIIYKRV